MKEYHGSNFGSIGPGNVTVVEEDGSERPLDTRTDLANHSPDGFQAGYGGSGPTQLALALLADVYDDETPFENTGDGLLYQQFKSGVIAGIDKDEWALTEAFVREWVSLNG